MRKLSRNYTIIWRKKFFCPSRLRVDFCKRLQKFTRYSENLLICRNDFKGQ